MIVTNGTGAPFQLPAGELGMVQVKAPGLRCSAFVGLEGVEKAGFDLMSLAPDRQADELAAALAENGIQELGPPISLEADPIATKGFSSALFVGDLEQPHVVLEVARPESGDEGMLLMIEGDEGPLWVLPSHFGVAGSLDKARWLNTRTLEGARSTLQGVPPVPMAFRFAVPAKALRSAAQDPAEDLAGLKSLRGRGRRAVARFFRFKWLTELVEAGVDKIVSWVAERIERRHKTEGLRVLSDSGIRELSPNDAAALMGNGQRTLLLAHGIFSSIEKGFGSVQQHPALMSSLRRTYGERIVGWDHWTVAKSTLENARNMLELLPPSGNFDILCHSRGAVVVRSALERPDLAALRDARMASVRKVVFVAGANRGSALARRANVDKLLSVFSLLSRVGGGGGVVLSVVLGALKVLAHAVVDLPGILDMDPDRSPALRAINREGMLPVDRYIAVRANYDYATSLGRRLLDLGADAIFREANDLVVPYAGTTAFDDSLHTAEPLAVTSFGGASSPQNAVLHTNFFAQPEVAEILMQELV